MVQWKAQLVAKGYSQVEGVDYERTFSPTTNYTSIRCVLQLATHCKWCIFQMNAESAFLKGHFMEEVNVQPSPGLRFQVSPIWLFGCRKPYIA